MDEFLLEQDPYQDPYQNRDWVLKETRHMGDKAWAWARSNKNNHLCPFCGANNHAKPGEDYAFYHSLSWVEIICSNCQKTFCSA